MDVLRAELELAGLAEKLILYRYRIAMASFALFEAIISETLALVLFTLAPVLGGQRLIAVLLSVALIALMFAVAILLIYKVYSKSTRSLGKLIDPSQRESVRRALRLTPMAAYTVPFFAVYAVHPAPLWETYAWYYALTLSSAVMYLFYERTLNRAVRGLGLRIYLTLTLAMAALSPPLCAIALAAPRTAATAAIVFFMAANVAASLQEIYRAEREL